MTERLKVLVVDDSPDDRFILARALSKTGVPVEVFEVEDGGEAIDFLRQEGRFKDPQTFPRPHLIFLDLKMPGLNGFDVLRWLQQNPSDPPIQVVVLSGSELESDKRLARELGASIYLIKPATPDQLRDLLCRDLRIAVAG